MPNALIKCEGEAGMADGTGCTDPLSRSDANAIDGEEGVRWMFTTVGIFHPGRIWRCVHSGHRSEARTWPAGVDGCL